MRYSHSPNENFFFVLSRFTFWLKMISIGSLLDICGIIYTKKQLIKLENLVDSWIKKLINVNLSHIESRENPKEPSDIDKLCNVDTIEHHEKILSHQTKEIKSEQNPFVGIYDPNSKENLEIKDELIHDPFEKVGTNENSFNGYLEGEKIEQGSDAINKGHLKIGLYVAEGLEEDSNIAISTDGYHQGDEIELDCDISSKALNCDTEIQSKFEQVSTAGKKYVKNCVQCMLPTCNFRAPNGFYNFPKIKKLKTKWIEILGLYPEDVKKKSKICSYHFSPDQIRETSLNTQRPHLKIGAVPTLNIPMVQNEDAKKVPEKIKPFECSICGIRSASKSSLRTHQVKYHSEIYQRKAKRQYTCDSCNSSYDSVTQINRHMKQIHGKYLKYFCQKSEKCDEDFLKLKDLRNHIETVHAKEDELLYCDQCEKKFLIPSELKQHNDRVHLKIKGRKKAFFCDKCAKSFFSNGGLNEHTLHQHNDGKKDFQCDLCGNCYATASSLKDHKKEFHYKAFKCDQCDKLFGTKFKLKYHTRTFHGSEEHQCSHCDKTFPDKYYLKSHVRKMHSAQLKCNECERSFGNEKSLNYHIKRAHSSDKPYKCEKCNESFPLEIDLYRHSYRSHNKNRPFECSTCFKTFNFKKTLEQHFAREHKLNGCESCPHCGKHFSRLQAHIQICNSKWPDGIRPTFECPNKCGFTSTNKDSLRSHYKKKCKADTDKEK